MPVAILLCGVACGGKDSTAPTPPPIAAVELSPDSVGFGALTDTARLTAVAYNSQGRAVPGARITWRSSSASVASVDSTGLLTAVGNGSATITAMAGGSAKQTAVTVAQILMRLIKVSGDSQLGAVGNTLPASLIVQAIDSQRQGIRGKNIGQVVSSGSGEVSPDSMVTDDEGKAKFTWVPGASSLTQTVDFGLIEHEPFFWLAAPVTFTAFVQPWGPIPVITSIQPAVLNEGQQATITGSNFDTTATAVSIDGADARLLAKSPTSITVLVPSFNCRPTRRVNVSVTAGLQTTIDSLVPLSPAVASLSLSVGQEAILQDSTQYCIRFDPSTSSQSYVMGFSAPAELPGALEPFEVVSRGGLPPLSNLTASRTPLSPARAPSVLQRAVVRRGATLPARFRRVLQQKVAQQRTDVHLLEWERTHITPLLSQARLSRAQRVPAPVLNVTTAPAVGDTLALKVPDVQSVDACANYATIKAVVRKVGQKDIWVVDAANPSTDSLSTADIDSASNAFDNTIFGVEYSHFGVTSDLDSNGRAIIVLTSQVDKVPGLGGFVFFGDLVPRTLCASSNYGELYYGEVPDPNNVSGGGARTKADVLARMPEIMAHEYSHLIQVSERLILASGEPMTTWEMEGQATLAEELSGHAMLGNSEFQNYDASVAFGPEGANWYEDEMLKLGLYFGDFGGGDQVANAPDQCSVYGNTVVGMPCSGISFYGASWMLQRYILDQYGPTYPNGTNGITRNWINAQLNLSGTDNIKAILPVDYDSLFVRFATALALDDLDNGTGTGWVPGPFSITSWNSASISTFLASVGWNWLKPPVMEFTPDTLPNRGVRGGSTAYTVLDAPAGHTGASFLLEGPNGSRLTPSELQLRLWIVRVN